MGDENNAMLDLEAAWDASDSTEEVAEVTPNEPDTGIQSDQHISAEPITPEGAGAVAAEVPGGQPGEEPGAAPAGEATSEKPTEPDVGSPVGLSAEAKAAWKDTPKAVQSEIGRRETDFARGIQKYAEGITLIKQCQGILDAAEKKIQLLAKGQGQALQAEGELDEPTG